MKQASDQMDNHESLQYPISLVWVRVENIIHVCVCVCVCGHVCLRHCLHTVNVQGHESGTNKQWVEMAQTDAKNV